MGGAAAWLRRARDELDPATTLVVGLDQIGAGDPHVLTGEGPPLIAALPRRGRRAAPSSRATTPRAGPTRSWPGSRACPPCRSSASRTAASPTTTCRRDTPDRVDWDAVERCLGAARDIATDFDR